MSSNAYREIILVVLIECPGNPRVLGRIFDRIISQRGALSILYITRLNQYFFSHWLFYYFRSNNISRNKISKNIMLDKSVLLQHRITSTSNKSIFYLSRSVCVCMCIVYVINFCIRGKFSN